MATRPKGYGFSSEVQRKKDEKYDPEMEVKAREFITEKTGIELGEDFHMALKDGVTLCHLANAVKPDSVKKINESKLAFKMMENIANFLKVCESIGCKKTDLFQTVDLYEKQNIPQVILCILAVKRRITGGELEPNVREFTEEQKKAGQGIIGLQMGSNKGASQSGDHFGRPRQVAGANVYK